MLPSGTPAPIGGAQSIPSSLLCSNSALLGAQGGQMPAQSAFPSLLSPRTQFNNINMLGNTHNVSSLLHQSFRNGIPNNGGAELDPTSNVGNEVNFSSTPLSMVQSNMSNPVSTSHMLPGQQPSQNLDPQIFQHNQPASNHHHHQQYQSIRGLNSVGSVKLEPQAMDDQQAQPSHQLHSLRNVGAVKLEPQQLRNIRNLPSVKMEPQNLDQSLFLHHHQQQQQLLHMSRQSPQAAAAQISYLHQQRLMQLRQQQQQQQQQEQQQLALNSVPLHRSSAQPQFQPQNMPLRSDVRPIYEPGMCARRLARYMYELQHRPEDNNIEFWRKFVSEFFAPNAKKKWCVSLYGNGRQTTGVLPQGVWHCEICNCNPGRGFESTAEVLPRLFKIIYESGTLEELLYVDMPREYQNNSGQIVLDYAKAIQESVFEQLRVVREGQLRLVFSPDLKICSWEFCAQRHEELIPRRLLIPQVSQLGGAVQKYQAAAQSVSSSMPVPELQNYCNMFVASAHQLVKAVEVPLVNDLGYTKRHVRCLQISEVVNSMKDLIDYSSETGIGPVESLVRFPRRTSSTTGFTSQPQIKEETNLQQQQTAIPNSSNNKQDSSVQVNAMQIASTNGVPSVNNSFNTSTTSSTSTVTSLHQSSMNSRHQNLMMNNPNGSYIGNGKQNHSPNSSSTFPQPNPSLFQSSTPLTSQVSHSEHDTNDSKSSVQKIMQEKILSPQMSGKNGMVGSSNAGNSDVKNVNGMLSASNSNGLNGVNGLVGNGFAQSAVLNGIRARMGNNDMSMNGRVRMLAMAREQNTNQQGLGDQFLSGLGAVNGFDNLQFDWKPSP